MAKQRQKGEKYRPVVEILKMKGKRPSVLMVSGQRYILDSTFLATQRGDNKQV